MYLHYKHFHLQDNTPLHHAASNNKLEAAKLLVHHGADLSARNHVCATTCPYILNRAYASPSWRSCMRTQFCALTQLRPAPPLPSPPLSARQEGMSPVGTAHRGGSHVLAKWLKDKTSARKNWMAVSASVNAFQYALFWQEYVCKQNCAPGGKFAKRDRDAFEAEFGH